MTCAVVDFLPPPHTFPSVLSLLSFISPSNGTVVEIQAYVRSKTRCAFSRSLFLREQLRGLACAQVSRIMITAAEKRISRDKARQSASRGLNQLPVAYCGANRKVTTTNNQAASYSVHKQGQQKIQSFLLQ